MKKSVKETLKLAVEQLFVRIHGDLFSDIYAEKECDFALTRLAYDPTNEAHETLVNICKEKIGYEPVATRQDIFFSIMKVYCDAKEQEKLKLEAVQKR